MISYKVLMTLTVIFIISSEADDRVQNCKVILAKLGITDDYGFMNYCIVRQFNINHFRNSLERNGIAFVHFQEENHEMTVNEEILTKFFEDNLGKDFTLLGVLTPLKYCYENINDKSGFMGCLTWMSRFRAMSRLRAKYEASKTKEYKKCEEEITKEYERIKTVTPTINVDGVEYPEHEKLVNQTYCKENIFENFIVSYNLMYGCYSDESIREIDEIVQLWPGSKRGFLQRQLKEFEALNKYTVFLTKTKWCMKYYDQKPIQESTSGTSPP